MKLQVEGRACISLHSVFDNYPQCHFHFPICVVEVYNHRVP